MCPSYSQARGCYTSYLSACNSQVPMQEAPRPHAACKEGYSIFFFRRGLKYPAQTRRGLGTSTPTPLPPPACPAAGQGTPPSWASPCPPPAPAAPLRCARPALALPSPTCPGCAAFPGEEGLRVTDSTTHMHAARAALLFTALLNATCRPMQDIPWQQNYWVLAWPLARPSASQTAVTFADEFCMHGRAPSRPYSLDEGAGALISVGALRSVSFEDMEDCVLRQWTTGAHA